MSDDGKDSERATNDTNVVTNINNYYGPVNHVGQAYNANLGINSGLITQNAHQDLNASPLQPPAPGSSIPSPGIIHVSGLQALLNPILDASHTRNRKVSPPNSDCFPGTRTEVIQNINSWVRGSLSAEPQHILWVFGYAGCGKSAIAQAVAVLLANSRRLGASFFFFRGSGDRGRMSSFAATLASQIATAIPGTAQHIEAALKSHPGLLHSTTSLVVQLKHLLYYPIRAVTAKWYRPAGVWRPFVIVIDGLDECQDKDGVSEFIKDLIDFFERKPDTPLRFLITSRVEDHLHQRLHNCGQVRLLNLVDHTSDKDIAAALEAAIEDAKGSRVLTCEGAWLTLEDKEKLIEHIGGSFIFMTTIAKFLFAPYNTDKRTPSARLPLALNMNPGFDGLYMAILEGSQDFPHFFDILSTIALAQESLSIAQITDLLAIDTIDVVSVLVNLHAIIQVPGDDHTPVTLWHTSLRDFLTSESRAGAFFANPGHHERLALRCLDLAIRPSKLRRRGPAFLYANEYVWDHYRALTHAMGGKRDFHSRTFTLVQTFKDPFLTAIPEDVLDGLYRSILASSKHFPFFHDIIKTIALMQIPLTLPQVADLLTIMTIGVRKALVELHPVVHLPADHHTPITFWHQSFLDFLHSEPRSGEFFAGPEHHRHLAYRSISIIDPLASRIDSPGSEYSRDFAIVHWKQSLEPMTGDSNVLGSEVEKFIRHLRAVFSTDFHAMAPAYFHVDHRFVDNLLQVHQPHTITSFLRDKCPQAVLNDEQPWTLIKSAFRTIEATLGEEALVDHLRPLGLRLLDTHHHLDMVMRGTQLLVKLRVSDNALVLQSGCAQRGYLTDYFADYMFTSWTKHLALALSGDPRHPAFDIADPSHIEIQNRETGWPWYSARRDWVNLAGLNLESAERVVERTTGTKKAPETTSKWDWDTRGHFILKKASANPYVTVYELLGGIRLLLSCYRSTCSHRDPSSPGSHCSHKDRHWEQV